MEDAPVQYDPAELETRFEPLEFTPELMMSGLTLWNTPVKSRVASHLSDAIRELFELSWEAWPPTVGVSQISVSTESQVLAIAGAPPEITWARVSIFGFGFAPGVPVTTKWNNAFGFPRQWCRRELDQVAVAGARRERSLRVPDDSPRRAARGG